MKRRALHLALQHYTLLCIPNGGGAIGNPLALLTATSAGSTALGGLTLAQVATLSNFVTALTAQGTTATTGFQGVTNGAGGFTFTFS